MIPAVLTAVGVVVVLAPRTRGRRPETGSGSSTRRRAQLWRTTSLPEVHRVLEALPRALDVASRSGRAGRSLPDCVRAAARAVPEVGWGEVVGQLDAGATLTEALDQWAGGWSRPETDFAVAVIVLGAEGGAPVAARLDRAAEAMRFRRALHDEVRAMTAQTRASATVVALAPVAFALLVVAVEPDLVARLFATPVGVASLMVGSTLESVGVWWMRRLTRVEP